MAKQLYKYMDVDVIAFLEEKMKGNTKHYQSDFDIDKRMLNRLSMSSYKEDKTLLWLSRSHGTHCLKEYEVFIKDTAAHNTWKYFAGSKDPIVAYAVELTGKDYGIIRGNLYELDYEAHAALTASKAVDPVECVIAFQDGYEHYTPYGRGSYGYYAPLVEEHGAIVHSLDLPRDKEAHAQILSEQKSARSKMEPFEKAEQLDFIFDDEITVSQDCTQLEGYIWATDALVSRLKAQEPALTEDQSMENINFYPVFDSATQTVLLEGHYYLEDGFAATGKAFKLPLTPKEADRLKEGFEAYCKKSVGMSCTNFLNQVRKENGLQAVPRKSLNACIAAAQEKASQNTPHHDIKANSLDR